MSSINDRLAAVQRLEDAKEKTEQYKKLLAELLAAAAEADIKEYVEHSECFAWPVCRKSGGLPPAPLHTHIQPRTAAASSPQAYEPISHCLHVCCAAPSFRMQSWQRASTCPWAVSCCLQSQRSSQSCQPSCTKASPTSKLQLPGAYRRDRSAWETCQLCPALPTVSLQSKHTTSH